MAKRDNPYLGLLRGIGWMLAILGVVFALNLAGPTEGWIEKVKTELTAPPAGSEDGDEFNRIVKGTDYNVPESERRRHPQGAAFQSARDTIDLDGGESPGGTEAGPNIPGTGGELEREFQELYRKVLAETPKPHVGQNYDIRLRSGSRMSGKLAGISPGMVRIAVEYGEMNLPIHLVAPEDVGKFFPERAAKRRTLKILRGRAMASRRPTVTGTPEVASLPTDARPAVNLIRPGAPPKFTPEPRQSSPELKPVLSNFSHWLEVQHRRIGGKVADEAYARLQGDAAVLYLVLNPAFLQQDYDLRFQFAESLWQFWAFRCQADSPVKDLDRSFIVMLAPGDRVIGGSKPTRGSEVWMSQKTQ